MRNAVIHSRSWISGVVLSGLLVPPAIAGEIEAGASYEHLTNDKPAWRSLYLDATHAFAPRQNLYGTVRETERFDLRDFELAAGYAHPFAENWTAVIEASHSPDHHVLADTSAFAQLYWAARNGKPEDAGSASSHRLAFDYHYFEDRSRIGVAVSWGREVENVGPPSGVITSDVRSIFIVGRHWLTPDWAIAWEIGTHEQGDLYRRTGGRLGLRHRL